MMTWNRRRKNLLQSPCFRVMFLSCGKVCICREEVLIMQKARDLMAVGCCGDVGVEELAG